VVRVAVLGHRGMLGSRVVAALATRHHVVTFAHRWPESLIHAVEVARPDWVVNCIRGDWSANADLPYALAGRFPGNLIQPSTDAIGEDTEYARSKAEGECGTVIRCGIVDPAGGLLAKVRDAGTFHATADGWNGITALAWAGIAEAVIRGDLTGPLIIPGSPPVSVLRLAQVACRVFGWQTEIVPAPATGLDRVLTPTMQMPPIGDQLMAYL
jgi:hypothetical protein